MNMETLGRGNFAAKSALGLAMMFAPAMPAFGMPAQGLVSRQKVLC